MTNSPALRPAWTPLTIGLMLLGFVFFWPLGLTVLAYILWGDKLDDLIADLKQSLRTGRTTAVNAFSGNAHHFTGTTGNSAFDDYRAAELTRLEEERQRLDKMRAEFDGFLRNLRRAKDQEEFDAFMSAHKQSDSNTNISSRKSSSKKD